MRGFYNALIIGALLSLLLLTATLVEIFPSSPKTTNLTINASQNQSSSHLSNYSEKGYVEVGEETPKVIEEAYENASKIEAEQPPSPTSQEEIKEEENRRKEELLCPFEYHIYQIKSTKYVANKYFSGYYTFTSLPNHKFLLVFLNVTNRGNETKYAPLIYATLTTNVKNHTKWSAPLGVYSEEYSPKKSTEKEVELFACSYLFKKLKPNESAILCIKFEILKNESLQKIEIRDDYCEFSFDISTFKIEYINFTPSINETKNETTIIVNETENKTITIINETKNKTLSVLNKTENETIIFYRVVKVIDGDTFELENGEKVRLLGINAPERGQKCYEESTNRLKELVEGKLVKLERDVEDRDQYGRLLRYVFINDTFVNLLLVKEGLANVYIVEPNTKYEKELREAENYAKENHIGCLWQISELTCSECIGILFFHYNAEGDDCENLNDEYVVFKNTCDFDCNLTGWKVKDEANHIYIFPNFILRAGRTVTLYTGCGENSESELYWCNSGYQCNAIWNNKGDTLYLYDNEGNLVLSYSYG